MILGGGLVIEQEETIKPKSTPAKPLSPVPEVFRAWPERALSKDTIAKYKVRVGGEDDKFASKSPRFDLNGNHVANKVRLQKGDKADHEGLRFFFEGDKDSAEPLFGQHLFAAGGRFITITEGYEDAMAVHQMFGGKYPAVSVENSASAKNDCKQAFEYLNSFDTIVVCFDNDDPGRKAAKEVASMGFLLGR
jgi:twinkle protein